MELNNLAKELSKRVENLLNNKDDDEKNNNKNDDDEWNFLLVDGFLLYVNQDVINELDIKLFVSANYDTLKDRRENRSVYITIEGM
jgi:nicotinamide/nicotinate riboside kinase